MIPTLYTGQQLSNNMDRNAGIIPVTINSMGSYLTFTGIDISQNQITIDNPIPGTGSIVAKLDLLFYNRLSLSGDVLSSIVWSNYPQLIDNTAEYIYSPRMMYKNTTYESALAIPVGSTNFKMFNATSGVRLATPFVGSNTFMSVADALPVTGMPSAVISVDSIATDGWYSLVSIGVCDQLVDSAFIKAGFLCQDPTLTVGNTLPQFGTVYMALVDNADTLLLTDASQWFPINIWTTINSVAEVINKAMEYNPWVRQDFFWTAQYDKVYRDAVIDYVASENNFGSAYINIKAMQTSIDYYATRGKYAEAQYILQGSDYYRTTHNFLG